MIEEQVNVVSLDGEYAWVETRRKSACGACAAHTGCGVAALSTLTGNRAEGMRALNQVGVKAGDQAVIGIPESGLLRGSFMVYTLPLLFMLFAAALVHLLWAPESEGPVILAGIAGLLAGFMQTRYFSRSAIHDHRYQPVILRRTTILSHAIPIVHE